MLKETGVRAKEVVATVGAFSKKALVVIGKLLNFSFLRGILEPRSIKIERSMKKIPPGS